MCLFRVEDSGRIVGNVGFRGLGGAWRAVFRHSVRLKVEGVGHRAYSLVSRLLNVGEASKTSFLRRKGVGREFRAKGFRFGVQGLLFVELEGFFPGSYSTGWTSSPHGRTQSTGLHCSIPGEIAPGQVRFRRFGSHFLKEGTDVRRGRRFFGDRTV